MNKEPLVKAIASLRAVLLYGTLIFTSLTTSSADPQIRNQDCVTHDTHANASETLDKGDSELDDKGKIHEAAASIRVSLTVHATGTVY